MTVSLSQHTFTVFLFKKFTVFFIFYHFIYSSIYLSMDQYIHLSLFRTCFEMFTHLHLFVFLFLFLHEFKQPPGNPKKKLLFVSPSICFSSPPSLYRHTFPQHTTYLYTPQALLFSCSILDISDAADSQLP